MKKLIGMLAASSMFMLAACSDDESSSPAAPVDSGSSALVTPEFCQANGLVYTVEPTTGVGICTMAALSSSSFDPNGGMLAASSSSLNALPAESSSSVAAPVASSSSVAPAPASSTPAPASSAPANDEPAADDGLFKLGLWNGTAGDVQVPTGNTAGGWWYSYADDLGSAITWKAELGADNDMSPVIEACGGICGDFVIGAGDPDENIYPYLGIAFGYGKTNAVGDATTSKGICVTYSYSGDATFAIELGMTQSQETKLSNALPMVELPAGTKKTIEFTWSEFEQPTWATTTMTGANAAKQLSSIKFKFADVTGGESGSFTIFKVGKRFQFFF